jgi:hypothetical protein
LNQVQKPTATWVWVAMLPETSRPPTYYENRPRKKICLGVLSLAEQHKIFQRVLPDSQGLFSGSPEPGRGDDSPGTTSPSIGSYPPSPMTLPAPRRMTHVAGGLGRAPKVADPAMNWFQPAEEAFSCGRPEVGAVSPDGNHQQPEQHPQQEPQHEPPVPRRHERRSSIPALHDRQRRTSITLTEFELPVVERPLTGATDDGGKEVGGKDGGKEDGGKEDGGKEDGGKEDGLRWAEQVDDGGQGGGRKPASRRSSQERPQSSRDETVLEKADRQKRCQPRSRGGGERGGGERRASRDTEAGPSSDKAAGGGKGEGVAHDEKKAKGPLKTNWASSVSKRQPFRPVTAPQAGVGGGAAAVGGVATQRGRNQRAPPGTAPPAAAGSDFGSVVALNMNVGAGFTGGSGGGGHGFPGTPPGSTPGSAAAAGDARAPRQRNRTMVNALGALGAMGGLHGGAGPGGGKFRAPPKSVPKSKAKIDYGNIKRLQWNGKAKIDSHNVPLDKDLRKAKDVMTAAMRLRSGTTFKFKFETAEQAFARKAAAAAAAAAVAAVGSGACCTEPGGSVYEARQAAELAIQAAKEAEEARLRAERDAAEAQKAAAEAQKAADAAAAAAAAEAARVARAAMAHAKASAALARKVAAQVPYSHPLIT